LPLPGRRKPDGSTEVSWTHLERLFDTAHSNWRPGGNARELVLKSGLPIADDAYLDTPVIGQLRGRPWRTTPIAYTEAPRLARLLVAAAAAVIGYLSGMRPGELLNLERDCVDHDSDTGLWLLRGKQWKNVVDEHGRKLPEGQLRDDPWVVVEPVAHAVDVLQRLHPHRLLFPAELNAFG
jgi:integrase